MSQLFEKIEEFKEEFKNDIPIEIQILMEKETQELKNANISKNALKHGDIVENFTLNSALNESISLEEILKDNNFAVISFYRGDWCPICNLELRALQKINNELKKLNAKLIAISPLTPDASLDAKEKNELEFEVLSDKNNIVAKNFGLIYSVSDALKPIYIEYGIDFPIIDGALSYELPMAGTFVINKKNEILYSFVEEDDTKRCEPQIILDTIRKNSLEV